MHVLWWSIGSEAMVPNKWKTHLQFSYSYLYEKSLEYFKQLESNNTKKAKKLTTYLAILKIYKKKAMKLQKLLPSLSNHATAESVSLPAWCAIIKTVLGKKYEKEIFNMPLSDNAISRRTKYRTANKIPCKQN